MTVVFIDLVNSTGLSEALDPEDLRDLLEAYYRCCSVAAERFGGHLAQYAGDGVVLYFGYPQAFELGPWRPSRRGWRSSTRSPP